ncbi:MAG: nucleotidyltransferase family protein [Elusimicrobia bacterium]|nr:nucleotidyltransferase family protein [Elusimicrobiota bacterium]
MERLKNALITPKATIRNAMKQMDEGGDKILFVVDNENTILGVVTDGNIRRWILKKGGMGEPISRIMNRNPIKLKEGYSSENAKDIMTVNGIECIPIVDNKNKVISAIWWTDLFKQKVIKRRKINVPVIIMAGGEGSRLAPFTKILPKPLMPIGDKPIIELIIEKFTEYGCKEFYLSVNYKSHIIKAFFSDIEHPTYNIHYINEEVPLGTAGSLSLLKNKIKGTICVSNCDILLETDLADIMDFHKKNKNIVTLVGSMKHFTIPYGVCKVGHNGKLNAIDEKPEYDFLVNTGMYILEPAALAQVPKNKFYHITDLINDLMKKNKKVGVYPISAKSWLDMGQFEELQEMLKKFGV